LDESRGVSRVSRTSASPGTRETRDENSLAGAVMMHAITRDELVVRLEVAAERLAGDGEAEMADAVRVALRVLQEGA